MARCEKNSQTNEPFEPQSRSMSWRGTLLDDRELWKRISEGNAESFDALYRESAPRLRAFLKHLLGNVQAAEDVTQDTFTEIWRRPHGFDPDRGSLRAYLFGMGRKRAAEWWRKQKPSETLNEEAAPCRTEESSMVAEAFERLNIEQRTLLWLREVEGQSYIELAAILEVPVGTVRSRLFVARQALRSVWHGERITKGGSHEVR
jgi:RNA polymerase sigma-70 factor, ECF subfamily